MGREVKRVALDFEWPLNEAWEGYINPHYTATKCATCGGSGFSLEYRALEDKWYGRAPFSPKENGSTRYQPENPLVWARAERNVNSSPGFYICRGELVRDAIYREAQRLCGLFNGQMYHHLNQTDVDTLIEKDRLWDFIRVPRTEEQKAAHAEYRKNGGGYWMPESNGYHPTAQEVNDWSISNLMGHDSLNAYLVIKARCERLGVPYRCLNCQGKGEFWPSPEAEKFYGGWEKVEPPAGEGWQMWETVSEGSPISPVFQSPEGLAWWLAETGASVGGLRTASYQQWLAMIQVGWAPSLVVDSDGVKSGVQAVAEMLTTRHRGGE
jgi:hypothetical protein